MRRLLILIPCLIAACAVPQSAPSAAEPPLTYPALGWEALGSYHARFEMRFEGTTDWRYLLETRADGEKVEYQLHLEGVESASNPGDVRVVVGDGITRMRGPGTDDECFQFPSDLALAPSFLTPEDVLSPETFWSLLEPVGSETVAGRQALHYTAEATTVGGWRDVEADVWLDETTDDLLRYELRAAGADPLFGGGEGVLSGRFRVNEVGRQEIEPIAGCEIDLPIPADATRLVRLPDLITFESPSPPDQVAVFYLWALPKAGWMPLSDPQSSEEGVSFSYRRGGQVLDVTLVSSGGLTYVELLSTARGEGARQELRFSSKLRALVG